MLKSAWNAIAVAAVVPAQLQTGNEKCSLMSSITRLPLCVVAFLMASSLGSLAPAQVSPPGQAPRVQPPPAATAPKAAAPPREAASAGDAALRQRIEQLEEQLVDMQVVVGTIAGTWRNRTGAGRQVPSPAAAFGAADAGRLDGIETQIRALAAQLEQVQEQVRALGAGAGVQPQAANEPPGAAPRPADRSMPARPSRSARASDP